MKNMDDGEIRGYVIDAKSYPEKIEHIIDAIIKHGKFYQICDFAGEVKSYLSDEQKAKLKEAYQHELISIKINNGQEDNEPATIYCWQGDWYHNFPEDVDEVLEDVIKNANPRELVYFTRDLQKHLSQETLQSIQEKVLQSRNRTAIIAYRDFIKSSSISEDDVPKTKRTLSDKFMKMLSKNKLYWDGLKK